MSKAVKNFVVVGGGANGVSTALMLTDALTKRRETLKQAGHQDIPESIVTVVDPKDYVGAGITYWDNQPVSSDTHLLWNNQPNERMILDPENRFDFTHFMSSVSGGNREPEKTRYAFDSRAFFGTFVNSTLMSKINETRSNPVRLQYHKGNAWCLNPPADGKTDPTLVLKNGNSFQDSVIVTAVGHDRGTLFKDEFGDVAGYFDSPTNIAAFHEHLERVEKDNAGNKKPIVIIGGGQSMIDVFAAYSRGKYEGLYEAMQSFGHSDINVATLQKQYEIDYSQKFAVISNTAPSHWDFHPPAHPISLDDKEFEPRYLTADYIQSEGIYDYEALKSLIEEEVNFARANPIHVPGEGFLSFGKGQILGKLDISEFRHLFSSPEKNETLDRFQNYLQRQYSSPTPPMRDRMLNNFFNKTGSAKHIQAYIHPEDIRPVANGGFLITIDGRTPFEAGTIVNAAAFKRGAMSDASDPYSIHNPFMRSLYKDGHIELNRLTPQHFAAGQQPLAGLYVAHGPNTQGRWGMESFATQNKALTQKIAQNHLLPEFDGP